jgi:TPR repeat protein
LRSLQVRLRRDALVATLLGQPRDPAAPGTANSGAWIAALNATIASFERDAAAEEAAVEAASERAKLRAQVAAAHAVAAAAAAQMHAQVAAKERHAARQGDAEAAVAYAAAAEDAARAAAAAGAAAAADLESALAAVAAGAGADASSAGSHWQAATGEPPASSAEAGGSTATLAAVPGGRSRVLLPPRRRASRSGTPVRADNGAVAAEAAAVRVQAAAAGGHCNYGGSPIAPQGIPDLRPTTSPAAAAAAGGAVVRAVLATSPSAEAAAAAVDAVEAALSVSSAAVVPESQRFQHHAASISDAELALEVPNLDGSNGGADSSSSSSGNRSGGGGAITDPTAGTATEESVAQRAMRGVASLRSRAKDGDAAAASKLGLALFCGAGQGGTGGVSQKPNVDKAVVYWTKAAKAGDASAQCSLGVCYMVGPGAHASSVPYKPEGAVKWWTRAAAAGCSAAMHNLGLLCARGYGGGGGGGPAVVVAPNPKAACEWFARGAACGHREAMNNLAAALSSGDTGGAAVGAPLRATVGEHEGNGDGDGVGGRNPAAAAGWYERAAALGSADAANNLGLLLWGGDGVPADPNRAVALWTTAAARGNPEAMCSLGVRARDDVARRFSAGCKVLAVAFFVRAGVVCRRGPVTYFPSLLYALLLFVSRGRSCFLLSFFGLCPLVHRSPT